MGTETNNTYSNDGKFVIKSVKLNNPLMGTETIYCIIFTILIYMVAIVKLNNPLMGTETQFYEHLLCSLLLS